jgi:sialate O-acetylesterase
VFLHAAPVFLAASGQRNRMGFDPFHNPVFVRYAWADHPQGANLYNKEGLPASPFEAAVPGNELS